LIQATAYQITFLHCIKFPYLAVPIKIDDCWARNVTAKKKFIQNWICIYTLKFYYAFMFLLLLSNFLDGADDKTKSLQKNTKKVTSVTLNL